MNQPTISPWFNAIYTNNPAQPIRGSESHNPYNTDDHGHNECPEHDMEFISVTWLNRRRGLMMGHHRDCSITRVEKYRVGHLRYKPGRKVRYIDFRG